MEIRNLSDVSFDDLFKAFSEAFRDYERTWDRDEFEKMLLRRGFVPSLSFGAFKGQQLVSFTLNGIGMWRGIQTAYDTGTGTLSAYRGMGLATKIFESALPYFNQAGISQYLLEVLQHNTQAVSVYSKIGFHVSREFNYFIQPVNEISIQTKSLSAEYSLKRIDVMEEPMMAMWDFQPSWQNHFTAIKRRPTDFTIIGTFYENELIGYGMIEPTTGDIPQLAVSRPHRRKGIGSQILKALLNLNQANTIKVINTDAAYSDITTFLASLHIPVRGKQYEMIKHLREP